MFLSRSKQTTELKENSDSFYSLKELVLVFPPLADTASKVRVLMNVTLMGWVTCSWSAQDRMAPLSRPALSSVAARPWWEDRWGQLPLSHLEHTGNTPGTWAWAPPVQPPAASHSPGPAPALVPFSHPGPCLSPCLLHFPSLLPLSVVSARLVVQTHGVPPVSPRVCVDRAAVSCLGSAGGRAPALTLWELLEMSRRTWSLRVTVGMEASSGWKGISALPPAPSPCQGLPVPAPGMHPAPPSFTGRGSKHCGS